MSFETPRVVDDKEKIRKSGLTEEESAEYKILWESKHASGGEEFELSSEEENRIRELEEKMQKFQDQGKEKEFNMEEFKKTSGGDIETKFNEYDEIITDEDEK